MSDKALWPVYEFRPSPTEGQREWIRYADGKWIPDDGEHDIAFVTSDYKGAPLALYVRVPYQKNIIWSWCKGGNWTANVRKHPEGNAWHYMLRSRAKDWGGSWNRDSHLNQTVGDQAMTKCADMHRCANGRGPEFHIGDRYIAAGLLRERDTKKVVSFPKVFRCLHCGDIELPEKLP